MMESWEILQDFLYGVDWTEPWVLALMGFHLTTTIAIILLRNHHYLQAVILSVLAVLCLLSETINEYAAMNYQRFAGQQYFDSAGLFIFVVFAGPMIFNAFLIVMCWLWNAWDLMGKMAVAKARRAQARTGQQQQQHRTDEETKKKQ